MKTLKPIIQTEEPDKYGRTVKIGITDGSVSSFFQVMSIEEVRNLRDELTKFLTGAKSQDSFAMVQASVKVGDTVKVRFEEFGMPDKHVVGRVVHPKRVYHHVDIIERRGNHCKGKTVRNEVKTFNIEQIIEVL